MPSSWERRCIEHFISGYNSVQHPKIIECKSDQEQEAPDAICVCENGIKIGLELTSVYPPKGTYLRQFAKPYHNLSPLFSILERKFQNNYRDHGIDEVWLLVHLRRTLPKDLVVDALSTIRIPTTFNRVYLHWPVPMGERNTNMGVLQLPQSLFWLPQRSAVA